VNITHKKDNTSWQLIDNVIGVTVHEMCGKTSKQTGQLHLRLHIKLESKVQMTSSFSEEYGSEEKKCRMGAIYKVVNAYCGVFLTYYFIAEGFLHLSQ
jgi:hypothetical protein